MQDFSIHAFADDPNELVAEYRSDMKLKSGREYSNTYVVRATVKDGKLIRFREHFDALMKAVAVNELKPVVDKTFDFDAAPDAYQYLKAGRHFGKIVIKI